MAKLESMVATAYERALDTYHQADVVRNTAEGIYFALALAKRLTRDPGSPGFGVDDRTEFALTIARRRIACDSCFALGAPAAATDVSFGPWTSAVLAQAPLAERAPIPLFASQITSRPKPAEWSTSNRPLTKGGGFGQVGDIFLLNKFGSPSLLFG